MITQQTAEAKLRELVLYVASRCEPHAFFGKIKLNKILFFSDMNAYLRQGSGVTNIPYLRRQFGPVPKGIDRLIQDLEAKREAVVHVRAMPDLTEQKRVVALRQPDLSGFSADHIAIVNEVIEWMRPMSAHEVSELTHNLVGWRVARSDEEIPYSTALLPESPLELTPDEVDYGVKLGQKIAQRAISAR